MTAAELTSIGAIVVSLVVLGVVPLLLARQSRRQTAELARQTQAREAALAERQEIKERAEREAKDAAGDVVSMEKVNRLLAATVQEERAANREKLVELREQFTAETARTKQLTDADLQQAKTEINRLADQIRELERELAKIRPAGGGS